MNEKIFLLILFFLMFSTRTLAQEQRSSGQEIIEKIAESYADNFSETTDLTPILEDLEKYIDSPLNINNATRNDFEQLHFLNSFQIENLIHYRDQVGQIYSQFELMTIEGFDDQLAADLSIFVVYLAPDTEAKSYLKQEVNLRYSQVLEPIAGFIADDTGEKAFIGIRPTLLLKYKAEKGNRLQWGLTAENDAGEEFFSGNNAVGFDYYSGYLGFKGRKILKEIIIGDYQVKTGQGLIQWSGYGIRKSSEGINVRVTGQGLRAYTSTDENNYLRGTAAQFALGKFELTSYYSYSNIDANIVEQDQDGKVIRVSSLQTSGYHRTSGELLDRNALNAQTAGANLRFTHKRFAMGLNSAYIKYNAEVNPGNQLYNLYNFKGNQNYNLGTDLLLIFNRINLFSEAAISQSGGKALIAGFESQPSNEVALSMVYRNYAPNFHTINGTAFSDSDGNKNESGIYAGISVLPVKHIKLAAYIDTYESQWLKYTSNAPIKGTDYLLQVDYTPLRKLSMYIRFKTETNAEKSSIEMPVKEDESQTTTRLRYNLSWDISEQLGFRFRTEWSQYEKEEQLENGILLLADMVTNPINKLSATARVGWFHTDGYNSRIYAYENDVPLYFYIPAFYDKGMRFYLNMSYEIIKNLKIYFKIAQSRYLNDNFNIGSGDTAIEGKHRTDLKIHLKYRF